MRIILARHALTEQTGALLTGWTPGVHLSEYGNAQAQRLADRLGKVAIEAVYTSPLERCRETAAPTARSHGLRLRRDKRFGEVGYGDWTGQAIGNLARRKLWTRVQYRPSLAGFPNGETLVEAQQRIVAALEDVRRQHSGNIVVCSHADMIKLAVAHYTGVHIDLYQRIVIATTSISVLRVDDVVGVQIELLNDTGSLAALEAGDPGVDTRPKRERKRREAYEEWGHA